MAQTSRIDWCCCGRLGRLVATGTAHPRYRVLQQRAVPDHPAVDTLACIPLGRIPAAPVARSIAGIPRQSTGTARRPAGHRILDTAGHTVVGCSRFDSRCCSMTPGQDAYATGRSRAAEPTATT